MIVVNHSGSSPGKQGFKMLVSGEENIGTIGGGIMELKLIEKCNKILKQPENRPILLPQYHHKSASEEERSGLNCNGKQDVVFIPLDKEHLDSIEFLVNSYENEDFGQITLTPGGLKIIKQVENPEKCNFNFKSDEEWMYQENFGKPNTVYIIGGGHVGHAITRILATLDFYVILIDYREDMKLFEQNKYAHNKILCPIDEIKNYVSKGNNSYVIIVTFGYATDIKVLERIVGENFKYLGVMGSKAKVRRMFKYLRDNGVAEKEIEQIKAPIGLIINNQTAEEIAVSVAAELIQIKNS